MPSSSSYIHTINYCEAPQIAPIILPKAVDATTTPYCTITVTPAPVTVTPLNVEAVAAAATAVHSDVAAGTAQTPRPVVTAAPEK